MEGKEGVQTPDQKPSKKIFSIVSEKEKDSTWSEKWKNYLDRNTLNEAWSAPEGSRWGRFEKTKLIDSINKWVNDIKPRYSEGEIKSEQETYNLIKSGVLDKNTAVILDSGGAHSVAIAIKLASEMGYQPIVMFNNEPAVNGSNKAEQSLATLLYFAEEVKKLKREGKIKPNSPPAFILDTHRNDTNPGIERFDNTYAHNETDFPSAQEFNGGGITKIVYLNEGDQHGSITPSFQSIDRVDKDLKPAVKAWEQGGIKMVYTGIEPWPDNDREGLSRSWFKF